MEPAAGVGMGGIGISAARAAAAQVLEAHDVAEGFGKR